MAASLLRPPRDPFDTTRQRLPGWSDDTSTLPAQSRNPAGPFDNAEADHRVDSPRTLTQTDVTALVINNMIGTGIFTGPYIVLVNTQSKSVAMGLWVAGFTHTIASMFMYLEFARKLPFTGGVLVYLDDLLPRFRLWTYTLCSFYFIFIHTASKDAINFASETMLATYKTASWADLQTTEINMHLLRFLAIVTTTAICLLLHISSSKSLLLNKMTAGIKILLLSILVLFGAVFLARHGSHPNLIADDSWAKSLPDHHVDWVPAFMVVLYSFHGWQNAILVTEEMTSFSALKWGSIWGISIVGLLYLLLTGILCASFDWKEGPLPNFTATFFSSLTNLDGKVSEPAAVATAVMIAVSSFGNMLTVAYAVSRVNRCIGWANVIPWSWLWRRTGPLRPKYQWREVNAHHEIALTFDRDALTHPGSPEGGIILYWLAKVAWICVTASSSHTIDAFKFSDNVLIYGQFFVEALLGIGFIWFDPFLDRFQTTGYPAIDWYIKGSDRNPAWWMRQKAAIEGQYWSLRRLRDGPLQTLLGIVIIAFSLVIVISDLWYPDGRVALYVVGGVLLLGWLYWCVFVRYESARHVFRIFGYEMMQYTHGVDDFPNDPTRVCHWCFTLHAGHRHPHDSDLTYNEFLLRGKPRPRFLYTIFGDGSEAAYLIQSWSDFKSALRGILSPDEADSLSN